LAVPGAVFDIVDVNDGSLDGNRRVIRNQNGTEVPDPISGPVIEMTAESLTQGITDGTFTINGLSTACEMSGAEASPGMSPAAEAASPAMSPAASPAA
jgi:hypothetical protein